MTPRLKRLELHGYKTFANKTVFEFPGNITAIVGPNGSGKSNIADSIRWVLGEQAYSVLRGKKTEDMIFTGSEDRPRASMASALILFNNEDSWLPIDFSEVSISRRAYRDGENEYLLNNQRVRLKEVNELLAQTGLSERTYTVIGQGLVDLALSLKPDERRKFFEEAAGIGLYRARREEALNRLENTRRNLERINDIVTELVPRQRSLEKQVKKVQEFERLRSELQVLLREWYGFQWHNSQSELNRSKEFLKNQEIQFRTAQAKLIEIEKQFEQFKNETVGIRRQLDAWHLDLSEQHRAREQTSKNLAVIDERLTGLRDKKENLQTQLYNAEQGEKNGKEQLALVETELAKLVKDASLFEKIAQGLRDQVKEIEGKKAEVENSIKQLSNDLVLLEKESTQFSIEIDLKSDQVRVNEHELRGYKKLLDQLIAESKDLSERSSTIKRELDDNNAELERTARQIQQRIAEKTALEEKAKAEAESNLLISTSLSKLHSQKQVLEDADRNFLGYHEGARSILEGARDGKLKGNYRTLLSHMKIPAKFEAAIEAALGENIDSIILEKSNDLDRVLTFLETAENGRAVLIHPETGQITPLKVKGDPEIFGTAAEVIECPEEDRSFRRVLLGRFLVVKDRATAKKVYKALPENCGAVTLLGEVFLREGIVIAGREKQRSRISRSRNIDDFEKDIKKTQNELDVSNKKLAELRQRQAECEEQLKSLSEMNAQMAATSQNLDKGLNDIKMSSGSIGQKIDWITQQQAIKTTENETAQKSIAIQKGRLSENHARIMAIRGEIKKAQESLNLDALIEKQTHLIDQETQLAVLNRSRDAADQRCREKRTIWEQESSRLGDLHEQIKGSENELLDTENNRNELITRENQINQKISEIQLMVDPAEKTLTEKEKVNQEFAQKSLGLRQNTTTNERYMSQAQLEVTRHQDKLDRLREKIEDDFGLVAFPYATHISGPAPLPFDGMVEQLPIREQIPDDLEDTIIQQRSALRRMGPINQEAEKEFLETRERIDFLTNQVEDMKKADADLRQVINELDDLMRKEFRATFEAVAREFQEIFSQLFIGGSAKLTMVDNAEQGSTGVDIEARLPGRREQGLSLLSGGERSLTAVALIFALLRVSPTPFCVLDEVDAMLDESNVGRFCEILADLSKKTQFIIITHNRNTVQAADVIYGVTMGKDSASQVISLKLDEITDELVQ